MSLSLLSLFLVLAMNMEMTLAILGFESESYSCDKATDLVTEWFASQVEGCDVICSTCSSNDFCEPCTWVEESSATVPCVDGCSYSLEGYTVERHFSSSTGLGQLLDNYFTLVTNGLIYTFTKGASEQFSLSWDVLAATDLCTASFSGQDCPCQLMYCDESKQSWGPQADCTGITSGALINSCLPYFGLQWKDDMTLMELLVLLPYWVCDSANQQSSAPVATSGITPPTSATTEATSAPVATSGAAHAGWNLGVILLFYGMF